MSQKSAPEFEANLSAAGLHFAVVVSRFNAFVTDKLLAGALDALREAGAGDGVVVIRIPGAFEFPVTVKALALTKKYDGIVCLGAVIRGDTPHFDYVAGEAARGITTASVETGVPMAFGILTTNTVQQAEDRAGGKDGNKGYEAAMTAIEMANLLRRFRAFR